MSRLGIVVWSLAFAAYATVRYLSSIVDMDGIPSVLFGWAAMAMVFGVVESWRRYRQRLAEGSKSG